MSLTVTQQPQNNVNTQKLFIPVYNEMIYVVHESSGATLAQPNFKYIAKIYDSANTTLLATIKRFPLADGYGVFDVHRILENFINANNQYDILYNDIQFHSCTFSNLQYNMRFGEEYGTTPTEHMLINSGVTGTAWNAIYDFPDFAAFFPNGKAVAFNGAGHYFTNAPLIRDIRTTEEAWLYFGQYFTVPSTSPSYMRVISYDVNNNVLATNDFSIGGLDTINYIRVSVGFNSFSGLGYVNSSTDHYTVQALVPDPPFGITSSPFGDIYRFNVIRCDPKYQTWRLHFLNKLGGFDSFTFSKVSHQNGNVERQTYKKVYGSESAGAWSYGQDERQMTQFDTRVNTKYTLNSDWISDAQMIWLKELLTSPCIFYQSTGGAKFIAVNIETSSYEIKKKINEKVFNLQIEISLSYDEYRQRG